MPGSATPDVAVAVVPSGSGAARAAAELYVRVARDGDLTPAGWPDGAVRASIRARQRAAGSVVVACSAGRVVGHALGHPLGRGGYRPDRFPELADVDLVEVGGVVVDPAVRGRGVGGLLVARVLADVPAGVAVVAATRPDGSGRHLFARWVRLGDAPNEPGDRCSWFLRPGRPMPGR